VGWHDNQTTCRENPVVKLPSKKMTLALAGAAGLLALGITVPAVALADPSPSPSAGSTAPDEMRQRHEARRAEYVAALAKELGIAEDKVAAALEKVDADLKTRAQADRQAALKERLDQAVKDGKLTQEQADAILKAAEEGVFPGGPGMGRGHRGPGGFPFGR